MRLLAKTRKKLTRLGIVGFSGCQGKFTPKDIDRHVNTIDKMMKDRRAAAQEARIKLGLVPKLKAKRRKKSKAR